MDLVEGGLSVEEDVEPPAPVHASAEQLEIAQAATGAGEAFVGTRRVHPRSRASIANALLSFWSNGFFGSWAPAQTLIE